MALPLCPVRARIAKQFGYQARFTHFPIAGIGPDCSEAEHPAASARGVD